MPVNKNAQIRYIALDRCLGSGRFYTLKELIDECSEALMNLNPKSNGVKKRQVQEDLRFLASLDGYQMDIETKWLDNGTKGWKYRKRNDSIRKSPINQEEIDLMHNALVVLKRFQGVPHFGWLDDLDKRLEATSHFGQDARQIVSFQENPYLKGMDEWYRPIFNAIVNKHTIEITYHPFGKEARTLTVYPYHLKQYNNRWFLIARRTDYDYFTNFAIDRIENVEDKVTPCPPLPDEFDFDEYFSEVVGVSVDSRCELMDVVLRVKDSVIGYIETKPLHESQTPARPTDDGHWEVHLKTVRENYELCSLLRSFGDGIEVVAPAEFRQKFRESVMRMADLYRDDAPLTEQSE
jgi:predicted DNA-binding transcriptional regulator YafY